MKQLGYVIAIAAAFVLGAISPLPSYAATKPLFHSHNDYQHKFPFYDALGAGMDSFEADVWLRGSDVLVSHLGFTFVGSFEKLYLIPLQQRVEELGSVYGDGREVLLWIDLKESGPELRNKVHELLRKYSAFTVYGKNFDWKRPVTAILTGDDESKQSYMAEHPIRRAYRDSNFFDKTDPSSDGSWTWYALNWKNFIHWDGKGAMPPTEFAKLFSIIATAHKKGRRVRFWNTPENERVWEMLMMCGADLIGADDIDRLARWRDTVFPSAQSATDSLAQ